MRQCVGLGLGITNIVGRREPLQLGFDFVGKLQLGLDLWLTDNLRLFAHGLGRYEGKGSQGESFGLAEASGTDANLVIERGERVAELPGDAPAVTSLAFDPDSARLLVGRVDGQLTLRQLPDLGLVQIFSGAAAV